MGFFLGLFLLFVEYVVSPSLFFFKTSLVLLFWFVLFILIYYMKLIYKYSQINIVVRLVMKLHIFGNKHFYFGLFYFMIITNRNSFIDECVGNIITIPTKNKIVGNITIIPTRHF